MLDEVNAELLLFSLTLSKNYTFIYDHVYSANKVHMTSIFFIQIVNRFVTKNELTRYVTYLHNLMNHQLFDKSEFR